MSKPQKSFDETAPSQATACHKGKTGAEADLPGGRYLVSERPGSLQVQVAVNRKKRSEHQRGTTRVVTTGKNNFVLETYGKGWAY